MRLLEDYWAEEWETVAQDFREIRDLGANVVRIHLQLGRFMTAEVFKQEPTCVCGVPTTAIGPLTTGAHVLDEIWKDAALGGVLNARRRGPPGRGSRSCRRR